MQGVITLSLEKVLFHIIFFLLKFNSLNSTLPLREKEKRQVVGLKSELRFQSLALWAMVLCDMP